jgi:hypothetical protein
MYRPATGPGTFEIPLQQTRRLSRGAAMHTLSAMRSCTSLASVESMAVLRSPPPTPVPSWATRVAPPLSPATDISSDVSAYMQRYVMLDNSPSRSQSPSPSPSLPLVPSRSSVSLLSPMSPSQQPHKWSTGSALPVPAPLPYVDGTVTNQDLPAIFNADTCVRTPQPASKFVFYNTVVPPASPPFLRPLCPPGSPLSSVPDLLSSLRASSPPPPSSLGRSPGTTHPTSSPLRSVTANRLATPSARVLRTLNPNK